ncbi:hypothetical protein FNV43_RR26593 [Rhamnella rubrinervis]|uniref:Strictosidine synthase conserved region domain-containing protein n=1 Tax=Rhamnella rubrinervis TaxID=2594499 RepID=A0A8K0DV87_9ROSA|nr:hypothetical protein FNV43_RR25598 [Rhamnella rubrinervis]KAF3431857.1 hypothetical protein FNV43_RR26593 [Rhamnella rubrinervis]
MKFLESGPLFWSLSTVLLVASSFVGGYADTQKNYELALSSVTGPETIAFDCHGEGPYASVSDGRILKWQGSQLGWTEFAIPTFYRPRNLCDGSSNPNWEPICGRPLGIKFNTKTCELYIADAYFGLLKVGPNGGVAQHLATSAEGIPFRLTNALDIDPQTGVVYFSDTSIFFPRRAWRESIRLGDKTGRLMRYDPITKIVTVLMRGLAFANGVALSKDSSFILVAESATNQVHRFWLRGPRAQTSELFLHLERSPDNINRNEKGEFWIAVGSGRQTPQNPPQQRGTLEGQVVDPWLSRDAVGIRVDEKERW